MRIACLLMQRNERMLLASWIAHHAALFGIGNLYVFDNGSTDPKTKQILSTSAAAGLNVDYSKSSADDFGNKGGIISDKIKELDDGSYDFFFPLDCDEFIGAYRENNDSVDLCSISKDHIEDILRPLRSDPHVLMIGSFLFNDPTKDTQYLLVRNPQKCFFAAGACDYLDIGYHHGRAKTTTKQVTTSLTYFHFHNKPYESYLYYANQKMRGRHLDRSPSGMKKYVSDRGAGSHLVARMLMTKDEYNSQFKVGSNAPFPVHKLVSFTGLKEQLHRLGHPISFVPPTKPATGPVRQLVRNLRYWFQQMERRLPVARARRITKQQLCASFGTGPTPEGYTQVTATHPYDPTSGYGWLSASNLLNRDRGFDDAEMRSFVLSFGTATFRIALRRGRYKLNLRFFDPLFGNHKTQLEIAGVQLAIPLIQLKRYETGSLTVIVDVDDGPLDLHFSSPTDNWILNSLVVEPSRAEVGVSLDVGRMAADLWELPQESNRSARRLVDRWQSGRATCEGASRTTRPTDYLSPIAGIVDRFAQTQSNEGAIVDPYRGEEFQYSTPCFAFAAALVAKHSNRPDLIEPATRAMTWATKALTERSAANEHEDFFPAPLALALAILAEMVPQNVVDGWRNALSDYDPFLTYRHVVGGSGDDGSNWNCKALVGEFLLHQQGIRRDPSFMEISLLVQGRFFSNEYGLYAEGPMVYDAFPRAWLSLLVSGGYSGPRANDLGETLERAALTSMLMQSPSGELPCGGRTSHHQWADAVQCVTFEVFASVLANRDELHLAGALKRSARLACEGLSNWRRATGELSIVKNRVPPAERHGFEGYSSHSQYNLLAATALGIAYQASLRTPDLEEVLTPAETGDFALVLPPPFNKIIANCSGTYAIICLKREHNGSMGLVRVHFGDQISQIGPSDALVSNAAHHLPSGPKHDVSIGCSWCDEAGTWRSLADQNSADVNAEVAIHAENAELVAFDVSYRVSNSEITRLVEHYELRKNEAKILYDFTLATGQTRSVAWPILVNDGATDRDVTLSERTVTVGHGSMRTEYSLEGCDPIAISTECYPHRNGWMRIARAVVRGDPILTIRSLSGPSSDGAAA